MTTVAQTELKEKRPLQSVAARGWRRGFANLLRKELGQWWGTKMWWVQLIIWLVIVNGISTIVMIESSQSSDLTAAQQLQEVVQVFLQVGAMAIGIGVVTSVDKSRISRMNEYHEFLQALFVSFVYSSHY